MPNDHPHILLLCSDQHSARVMGCAGDPIIRTPNLDRLAERGVMFDNAYAADPICVPGRYAIMTGKLPSEIGSLAGSHGLDPKTWTYPKHFARAGYQTTCVGKMHFMGAEQMHGWMFRPFGDMELHRTPTQIAGYAGDPYGHLPKAKSWGQDEWIRMAGPSEKGFQIFDEMVTGVSRTYLRDYFENLIWPRNNPGRPMLFQCSWLQPHSPFYTSKDLYDYYRPLVGPPEIPCPEEPHPFMRHHTEYDVTPEQILNARAAYYGMVEHVDRQIGIVLETLDDLGVLGDFLILYHSDHGEFAGNHGYWGKGKMYEDGVRVPLILSQPGRLPEGTRVRENVSLMDVFPTLTDYAGLDAPPDIRGESLRSLVDNPDRTETRTVISEHHKGHYTLTMAKRGDVKFVSYHGAFPDQLFDLARDPREEHNLAGAPEYAEIQAALQEEVGALPEPFRWDESADYLTPDSMKDEPVQEK